MPKTESASRAEAGPKTVRLLVDSSGIGGIERHIAVLAGALRSHGVDAEVWLYADHGANPWLDQLEADAIPYEILQGSATGLAARLLRERIGLLHSHGYKAGVVGRLAARLTGTPVVSTFHAGETGRFPVNLYQKLDEWTSLLAPRISVSAAIAARLPFSSRLIGNFIAAPDRPPQALLPPTVAFVGRLSHEKGPDLFCALAAADRDGLDWRLYGDGFMRAELEKNFGDKARFCGMVSDLTPIWPQIGLLLMPSRAEGLPMAALEALAAGVPVAAARVGALPELIRDGENGWLFDPGDLDAAGRIVAQWAAQRPRSSAHWREAAWRAVRENYGVEAGLRAVLETYAEAGFAPD